MGKQCRADSKPAEFAKKFAKIQKPSKRGASVPVVHVQNGHTVTCGNGTFYGYEGAYNHIISWAADIDTFVAIPDAFKVDAQQGTNLVWAGGSAQGVPRSYECPHGIPQGDLPAVGIDRASWRWAILAVSISKAYRPELEGVRVERTESDTVIVGCDGRRLHVAKRTGTGGLASATLTAHSTALVELATEWFDATRLVFENGICYLSANGAHTSFACVLNAVDGFAPWRKVMHTNRAEQVATLSSKELLDSIKPLISIKKANGTAAQLVFDGQDVTLKNCTVEASAALDTPIANGYQIAVDRKYFCDVLQGANTVQIGTVNGNEPITFHFENGNEGLVMPMRL